PHGARIIFCKRTSFAFQEAVFQHAKDGFLDSKRAPFRPQKVSFCFSDSYNGIAERVLFGVENHAERCLVCIGLHRAKGAEAEIKPKKRLKK
ncbi:hypothetical protein, partial [Xylanibacter caecicola]|uniref:hypothetical protein n=1 Tax=Xylanibacter caecicola TaxID=2736294 RepID=UPI00259387B0